MKKECKLILGLTESKTKRKAWHFSSVSEKHKLLMIITNLLVNGCAHLVMEILAKKRSKFVIEFLTTKV